MRQQRSWRSWHPCQHENGKEHRLFEKLEARFGHLRIRRCGSMLEIPINSADVSDQQDSTVTQKALQLKLRLKAAEIAHHDNDAFGPGTIKKRAAQWWFKKFCSGDESLEKD
ncbi:hypothetical protein NECAME_15755 [Necator americanus]|uniref:Mos1 transposase HTH domain-containing protein n=1 Tax=Necator americanus TaxID=51031 RepID=W2SG26_NECAM|nr:hypothetical protein NECAME_15755 [Necator americanus]ETN68550.1 hypothetical protein NECAME_15755 [Necator americanus]